MPCPSHDTDHAQLLRRAKMRVTAARIAILDVLCHADRAIDAQEVADRLRAAAPRSKDRSAIKTDRVTVYRTLNTLARSGIAHRVHTGDRVWRYALAGASEGHLAHTAPPVPAPPASKQSSPSQMGHDHPHFVCDACGRVECLDELSVILKPARAGASAARVRRERRITRLDAILHGTCAACRAKAV